MKSCACELSLLLPDAPPNICLVLPSPMFRLTSFRKKSEEKSSVAQRKMSQRNSQEPSESERLFCQGNGRSVAVCSILRQLDRPMVWYHSLIRIETLISCAEELAHTDVGQRIVTAATVVR